MKETLKQDHQLTRLFETVGTPKDDGAPVENVLSKASQAAESKFNAFQDKIIKQLAEASE